MRATIVLLSILFSFSQFASAAPTRIEDLTCSATGPGRIECVWTTPAPTVGYVLTVNDCRRSTVSITERNWTTRTPLSEPAPVDPGTGVNLAVTSLLPATLTFIACKTQDSSGSWSLVSNVPSATTWTATRTRTLAWDPSVSPEVSNYRVYWGSLSGNYSFSADAGNQTAYTALGLSWTSAVYFAVKGTASDGRESAFSNEVVDPAY